MSPNKRTDLRSYLQQLRIFFAKQSNHRTLAVLFYIFDISYRGDKALLLVAAGGKTVKMYFFDPEI